MTPMESIVIETSTSTKVKPCVERLGTLRYVIESSSFAGCIGSVARPGVRPPVADPLERPYVAQGAGKIARVELKYLGTVADGSLRHSHTELDVESGDDGALDGVVTVRGQGSTDEHQPIPTVAAAQGQISCHDQNSLATTRQRQVSIHPDHWPVVELGGGRPDRRHEI